MTKQALAREHAFDTLRQQYRRVEKCLSWSFVVLCGWNLLSFVVNAFLLFLSLGLLGWDYLMECWYQPFIIIGAIAMCHAKKKFVCVVLPVAAALCTGLPSQIPLGLLWRDTNNYLCIVAGIACLIALRKDDELRLYPEYPYFNPISPEEEQTALREMEQQAFQTRREETAPTDAVIPLTQALQPRAVAQAQTSMEPLIISAIPTQPAGKEDPDNG